MSFVSAVLWLAAAPSAQPTGGFEAVEALYAAAKANDETKFSATIGEQFGFFAAPDFVIPMKFSDFEQFAEMCGSPSLKSSAVSRKMATLTTVTIDARCKNPKTTEVAVRGFDFWVVGGKVIAIRPEGMR